MSSSTSIVLGKVEILRIFKDQLIKFLDSLIELFPEEGDMIALKVLFEFDIPIESALSIFAKRILPARKMIEEKNDKFFLENFSFAGLKEDKVIRWKIIWNSKRLDKDDKEMMWKWMKMFLTIAIQYSNYELELKQFLDLQ